MKKLSILLIVCMATFAYAVPVKKSNATEGKVIVDNEKVKVTLFESDPKTGVCGKDMHSHVAHLTVLLTEAEVAVTTPDGKTVTQKVPAGTTFWSGSETHQVINVGKTPTRSEIIELK